MVIQTTVVGSWPKPDYLHLPDWFRTGHNSDCTVKVNAFFNTKTRADIDKDVEKATRECVQQQEKIGIDIITDGELGRENYIYHFCRNLCGYDFKAPEVISMRKGATGYHACVCTGPLSLSDEKVTEMVEHWRKCQSYTKLPVKVTIPGPMTIIDTTANSFYSDVGSFTQALISCINKLVRGYASAGCEHIQMDEPVLVRHPQRALEHGISDVGKCFEGVGPHTGVERIIHLCCGYPNHLDQEDFEKADKDIYWQLAPLLDQAPIDTVSLEDAHRRNNPKLFGEFKSCRVIVGVVKVASSQVESVGEIEEHILSLLQYIPRERLLVAPDCGLGFLPQHILQEKLRNMVTAAAAVSVDKI